MDNSIYFDDDYDDYELFSIDKNDRDPMSSVRSLLRRSRRARRTLLPFDRLEEKEPREKMKLASTNDLYYANYHINDNENFSKVLLDEFRRNNSDHLGSDSVQMTLSLHPNKTVFNFVEILKSKIVAVEPEAEIVVNYSQPTLIEIYSKSIYFCLNIVESGNSTNGDVFVANKDLGIDIIMFGSLRVLKKIYKDIRKKYIVIKPTITWLFRDSDGSINGADFDLVNPSPVYQEYYPYIDDIKTFGKRFLDSSASVLVLYGPPGSGKTSFIRNMLVDLNEGCLSTFDDEIMQSDRLYIRFLNNYHKFLVLEDADTLLMDREKEQNKVMSKILSASDGLVNISNKKMIFTTNLNDVSKIDEALIRPGRCFDVMHFRRLDRMEAEAAAKKMGTTVPESSQHDYSLAELFNSKTGVRKEKIRVGFLR